MNRFLSCDWGTTAFRLRLVGAAGLKIIAEESTKQGIAETFQLWRQTERSEDMRLPFYLDIISRHIQTIEEKTRTSLEDLPLVISGMASSTIGMIDLPYKKLPVSVDGSDLTIHTIESTGQFKNKAFIISGLRTDDDVIRGEETKLVGCAANSFNQGDQIYIFPGTHPKHVEVKNGVATGFKTYMTGEFFELLSKKSILSVSVKEGEGLESKKSLQSFKNGVKDSINSNLLHNCFLVRTNDVFKKLTAEENYHYLSGLLIGAELGSLINNSTQITVIGGAALSAQYVTALQVLDSSKQVTTEDADEALIKGQVQVYRKLMNIL
ncbi:MAG: hypothetical protein JWQ40_3462 [Segetibacter sp.]|nr:hypothetical protein [Segetibacter sp.]